MLSNEMKKDGGISVEELDQCLRGGSMKEKRQRVHLFVDTIMND